MTEVVLIDAAETFTSVAVKGRLDAAGVGEVDLKLTAYIVPRQKPAVIDLTEVAFIASLGIGMLVTIAKSLRARGMGVGVVAHPPVRTILETTHLAPLLEIAASREDALRAIGVA